MNFETNYCGGIFYLILFIFACIYMNRLYYGNGRYDGYKRPLDAFKIVVPPVFEDESK